jgi:hypothetical protein
MGVINPDVRYPINLETCKAAAGEAEGQSGEVTSNTSPANVVRLGEAEPARWLASGVDTLVLTAQAHWTRRVSGQPYSFFDLLADLKQEAKEQHQAVDAVLKTRDDEPWQFSVAPNGASGYEWLIQSRDVALRIQNSYEPGSMPSIVAEIHSELLWSMGPEEAVAWLTRQLTTAGADLEGWKVSRVDLCCDVLIREKDFRCETMMAGTVCRARKIQPVFDNFDLETYMIGRGQMCGRIYDKPAEIRKKSFKWWMFGRWEIEPEQIPDDHRIVRAEFQVRRETLGELAIDQFRDLMDLLPNLWAYCSRRWFRLVDDRHKHHTHQQVRPWWSVVQAGVNEAQDAAPLVRAKAVKATKDQILRQLFGQWVSYLALDTEDTSENLDPIPIAESMQKLADEADAMGLDGYKVRQKVNARLSKYRREQEKAESASETRSAAGLPTARNRRRQMRKMRWILRRQQSGDQEGDTDQRQSQPGEG